MVPDPEVQIIMVPDPEVQHRDPEVQHGIFQKMEP